MDCRATGGMIAAMIKELSRYRYQCYRRTKTWRCKRYATARLFAMVMAITSFGAADGRIARYSGGGRMIIPAPAVLGAGRIAVIDTSGSTG